MEAGIQLELLKRNIEHSVAKLLIGDVAISERTVVEVKRLSFRDDGRPSHDFVASLKDNRLFEQCQNMRDNYERSILVIQEYNKLFSDKSVEPSSIYGSMVSVSSKFGIHIIPTEDTPRTVDVLIKLEEYDNVDGYSKPINRHPKAKSIYEEQIYFISGLLDVGFTKSVRLLTALGTPTKIIESINSSHFVDPIRGKNKKLVSELLSVGGFGIEFVNKNKKLLITPFDPKDFESFM
jgi:Fanconi anemia group M protein